MFHLFVAERSDALRCYWGVFMLSLIINRPRHCIFSLKALHNLLHLKLVYLDLIIGDIPKNLMRPVR